MVCSIRKWYKNGWEGRYGMQKVRIWLEVTSYPLNEFVCIFD
jgi:hypothetical protein